MAFAYLEVAVKEGDFTVSQLPRTSRLLTLHPRKHFFSKGTTWLSFL
jgi:hypothetical protein